MLQPGEAYAADVSCVQAGLDALLVPYRVQNPGVVALYVTQDGNDLRFDKELYAENAQRRIVFITGQNVNVKIDRNLSGNFAPDVNPVNKANLTPVIEAAFVVTGTLEFEGTSDPDTDPDISVVVEGPILGKAIMLNRDRGLTNYFPSEIIMYNNYYLYSLTNAERTEATGINNFTGLFVVDVDWISEE
jgi:hypothetical protein